MPWAPGTLFGPYEILGTLGAGGMGEVYRARDTKLKREVALKVVPELFADDPERLARFRCEAELLASLNHPNIASVHGFEESGGVSAIVMELVEGGTLADRLDDARQNVYPTSFSPDGRFLLYHTGAAVSATSNDIWALPLFGDRKPISVLQTRAAELAGQFSQDGRWIAYQSNELGEAGVFVVPFSATLEGRAASSPTQVSTVSGGTPRWRRDGKELFYSTAAGLMAAEVNGEGDVFKVGAVRPLFDVVRRRVGWRGFGPIFNWDVSADGQRFLVNTASVTVVTPPATVVLNWAASLRR